MKTIKKIKRKPTYEELFNILFVWASIHGHHDLGRALIGHETIRQMLDDVQKNEKLEVKRYEGLAKKMNDPDNRQMCLNSAQWHRDVLTTLKGVETFLIRNKMLKSSGNKRGET